MTRIGTDWRVVDGTVTSWFAAPSLIEGAALAGLVTEITDDVADGVAVDVRATGVRVRLPSADHAEAVSRAAHDLGLAADPAVLQHLGVVVESAQPDAVARFWQPVLGYEPTPDGGLADPWQRDPELRVRHSTESRPLRNRIHLDVVRPAAVVAQVLPGEPSGPFEVRHADPDGNEVDLLPGDPLGDGDETADWQVVFGAVACYRVTSAQRRSLVTAAAALAHDGGFPLMIDVRPGLVVLDSGKDQWDADAHGLALDFTDLAARLQTAARDLGATAAPALPRFTQLFLDAADVAAVRAFWVAALGYVTDRRDDVSDVHDPRRLNPVLVFQELDASDAERRAQRNRTHVELAVPADVAPARLAAALAAGGRVVDESDDRWRVCDPEGNELMVIAERA